MYKETHWSGTEHPTPQGLKIMHMDLVLATSRLVGARLSWVVLLQAVGWLGLAPGCEWVQLCPKYPWSGMEGAENTQVCSHARSQEQTRSTKLTSKFKASALVISANIPLAKARHVAQAIISEAGSLLPNKRRGKGVNMCLTNYHNECCQEFLEEGVRQCVVYGNWEKRKVIMRHVGYVWDFTNQNPFNF